MRYCIFIFNIVTLGMGGHILSTPAYGQDVSLFIPSAAVVDYDPFEGLTGLEDIVLEAQNTGDTPLDARLVITADTQDNFLFTNTGTGLEFGIESAYGNSNTVQFDVPLTLPSSPAPQPIKLTFRVPSGQYADHGDYEIDLKAVLVDSLTAEAISDEMLFTLVARVPLRAQTNFAGTSSGFMNGTTYAVVNFGEIISGDSRSINFQVRGNSDVNIAMSSENNGKMVNLAAPHILPIAYSVNADGINSDLSTPLEFTRRPERSLNGSSYPLTIMLDELERGAFAGEYKDIISIDVTAR